MILSMARCPMPRIFSILVKTVAASGLAWLTFRALSYIVPWALSRSFAASYFWLYVATDLITFVAASVAVISLTRKNLWRVTWNTVIILVCCTAGLFLGHPTPISHGMGEVEQDRFIGGVLGTTVGYLWTLLRDARANNKARLKELGLQVQAPETHDFVSPRPLPPSVEPWKGW